MKVSVILPTYNEKKNISLLIPRIEQDFFIQNNIKGEIIVVDDSSPDETANIAKQLNKKYGNINTIIKLKKEGIGTALRVGYNAARYEIILSSDVDLSFDVKDMKRLYDAIIAGNDLVVGSRHMPAAKYDKPNLTTLLKGFVSKFGNIITRIISGVEIHDFSANFRAIKKDVWKSIKTKENTNSILFEMIMKAHYKGYKVAEIPVRFRDRIYGVSKLNLKKEAPKFFIKLLYYTWQCRITKKR